MTSPYIGYAYVVMVTICASSVNAQTVACYSCDTRLGETWCNDPFTAPAGFPAQCPTAKTCAKAVGTDNQGKTTRVITILVCTNTLLKFSSGLPSFVSVSFFAQKN
jgi:hypothetical protein